MSGAEQNNNSRVIKEKHIFIVIVVLSFVITLIGAIIYLNRLPKLKLREISYVAYQTKSYEKLVHLDSSDSAEIFTLSQVPNELSYKITISDLSEKHKIEFKIKAEKTNLDWITFDDLNGDGSKEIIALYLRRDSLYQSIFNQKTGSFFSGEKLVMVKPEKALHKKWFFHIKTGGIISDDSTGKHLIFIMWATGAVYPRAVFDYSLSKQKIVRRLDMLSSPYLLYLFDLNNDGKKEIIVSTMATATVENISDKNKYDFYHSWVIALKHNFEPLFTIKKGPKFSFFYTDTLSTQKGNFIVAAHRSPANSNYPVEILKIDSTGKVVKQVKLKAIRSFYFSVQKDESIWFAFKDTLKIFNDNLKTIHKVSLPSSKSVTSVYEFSFPGGDYFIGWAYGNLYVFDRNYNLILYKKFEYSEKLSRGDISIFQNRNGGLPYVLISGKAQRRLFEIAPNNPTFIIFFIFLGVWILLSLFLYFSKVLLQKVFIYYFYFSHSSARSSNMIILIDSNKKVRYMNQVAKTVFCRERSKCDEKGHSHYSWLSEVSNELYKFLDVGIQTSNEATAEFTVSTDKQILRVKGTFIPFVLFNSYPIGYYCSLVDLSKSIEAERAKVYSHSIQKVAHEIKTPLNSLLFTVKSLEFQHKSDEEVNQEEILSDLRLLETEVKRIKTLTNNLLKFANLQKPHFKEVNIEEIISKSIEKFEPYRGKGVEFKITGALGTVFADEFQMKEAFQILIENSIDAMKANGKVEIIISKEVIHDVEFLKIMLLDEGGGIPEKIHDVLFDPYVTTKLHGTGMGLAIAQKIVEDHGSKLTFTTGPNGTIFSFYLKCINCGEEV